MAEQEHGRVAQRRRTREAIVGAASHLLQAGRTPSVSEVAEAADVSRRTVYQYFPTLEQLLIDATLAGLSQREVDEAIDAADVAGDAEARVAAMVRVLTSQSAETLELGRSLLRLTVDPPAGGATRGAPEDVAPRRGYRRVGWIERALEPVRPRLDEARFERLVSALAMVVGWEALIVLEDVRGLSPGEQREVSTWAARQLVRAALAEQGAAL